MTETREGEARRLRVVLADDHALVLSGLRAMLEHEPDIEIVATASDGVGLLAALRTYKPDVAVVDLQMPNVDGLTCIERIRSEGIEVRVLVLSAFSDGESIQTAMEQQADGFALKTEPPQMTLAAIRQVARGQIVFPRAALKWLRRDEQPSPVDTLSPREREILTLVAQGLSNQEIAESVHLSESTVKFHLQNVYQKLGVAKRTEAARLFFERTAKTSRSGVW